MRKVLSDTSAYSHLLRGSSHVADALGRADLVYMSVFVLAELYAGFFRASTNRQGSPFVLMQIGYTLPGCGADTD